MTGHAAGDALAAIRSLVENAKGMPMTSNVLVPKAETLALLDQAEGAIAAPHEAPDARTEAERIVSEAQARADQLVADSEVTKAAEAEAAALKVEADTWVDGRLSELEAGLHRTLEEIATLRERLHQRSRSDDGS